MPYSLFASYYRLLGSVHDSILNPTVQLRYRVFMLMWEIRCWFSYHRNLHALSWDHHQCERSSAYSCVQVLNHVAAYADLFTKAAIKETFWLMRHLCCHHCCWYCYTTARTWQAECLHVGTRAMLTLASSCSSSSAALKLAEAALCLS